LESLLFLPFLFLLLVGMIQLARVTYTYYHLHKVLYNIGRYVGTQQGVNFCTDGDPAVANAKSFGLTGTTDSTASGDFPNLTPDMIQVRIERVDASSGELLECSCSATGCDPAQGGQPPDYVVVTIPDGYSIQLTFPFFQVDPIPLRPQVRVPYGGT
jgi:hypothetical protein